MSNDENAVIVWAANEPVAIPQNAPPTEIANFARQLTERDVNSIRVAFESESYEMVSTFVWARASVALKKQISLLGMEFVGEMLGRPDITNSSDPATSIGDYEAISLAEDLGMMTTTEAMRLKHALVLVSHFADPEVAKTEQMNPEEAVGLLRSCVTSVLGNETISPPLQFAELRGALETTSLQPEDGRVQSVLASPYFIQKTALSVLLSLVKSEQGAQSEHAIGNSNVLIPLMWPQLRKPERWQVGQSYAEVNSAGNRSAAIGLKNVLVNVQGFDFVPENLRSNTFASAAHAVMEAHYAHHNFYKEAAPMRILSQLGSTIPKPAFQVCMSAVLAVRLGNRWGETWDAQPFATTILNNLRKEQWEYYLNDCLPTDKSILEKLAESKPLARWKALAAEYRFDMLEISNPAVVRLFNGTDPQIESAARTLRNKVRE